MRRLVQGAAFEDRPEPLSTEWRVPGAQPFLWTAIGYEYDGPFVSAVCDLESAASCAAAPTQYVENLDYDEHGSVISMGVAGGLRTYEYDPTTRYVTKDRFDSGSAGTYWVERLMKDANSGAPSYDEVGNVLEIVGTSSLSDFDFTTKHTFDEQGRVNTWERVGHGAARTFEYDAIGNLIENADRAQVFDDPAHPHAIASRDGGSIVYTYDADGNVVSITEGGSTRHFTFDSAGRMTCLGTTPGGCDTLDVTYDLSGMRVKEVAGGTLRRYVGHDFQYTDGPVSSRETVISIQVNGSRVATKTLVGGELAEVIPGTAIWIPTPDVLWFVMWLSVGGAMTLVLVGQAQREPSWHPLRRRIRSAIAASVAVQFATVPLAWAGGGAYAATVTMNWVLSDAIGSALVEVDSSGDRLTHALYEPFGKLEESVGAGGRRYFAGHPFSEDAGLNYMVARWHDPEAGVFLSVDPLVANEWDPQSYNAFAYARNNPISMNDPTGKSYFYWNNNGTLPRSEGEASQAASDAQAEADAAHAQANPVGTTAPSAANSGVSGTGGGGGGSSLDAGGATPQVGYPGAQASQSGGYQTFENTGGVVGTDVVEEWTVTHYRGDRGGGGERPTSAVGAAGAVLATGMNSLVHRGRWQGMPGRWYDVNSNFHGNQYTAKKADVLKTFKALRPVVRSLGVLAGALALSDLNDAIASGDQAAMAKAGLDLAMVAVGFAGPGGAAIATSYFILDSAGMIPIGRRE